MLNPTSDHGNPDKRYLSLVKDVEFRPVFIMGSHRSGTTLLYRLLAETGCFNVVTAYHVIQYDALLANYMEGRAERARQQLHEKFSRLGMKDRVIDEVPTEVGSPAEYGFIMARGSRRPRTTPENLPKLVEMCRKIQYISDPDKPIILKNPWDAIKFVYIKNALPGAKFVFIHRHPLLVMSSFLRAMRSVLASRNEYLNLLAPWYGKLFDRPVQLFASRLMFSPRFGMGESLMARYMIRIADYFVQKIGSLPATDYLLLRYEDLCAQPDANMEKILGFLGTTPQRRLCYDDLIRPRRISVLPDIQRKYITIQNRLQPYLAFHHYDALPLGA